DAVRHPPRGTPSRSALRRRLPRLQGQDPPLDLRTTTLEDNDVSTDYGEKERQFLETLEADTGRGLDAWMAAIAAAGLADRNDIIDWLRRQGFMFSKASWIERIHNNGGRPLYAGAGSPRARPRPRNLPPRPPAHATAEPAPTP